MGIASYGCGQTMSGNTIVSSKVVYSISGGKLKDGATWQPREVQLVEGRPFVAIGERDHMLKGYLGIRKSPGFFKMILEKRNEAVEKLILKIVNKTDEFAVAVPDAVRKDPPELDCKLKALGGSRFGAQPCLLIYPK